MKVIFNIDLNFNQVRRFNSAKCKKSYTHRNEEIRMSCKEIMKETWRFQADETNFDCAFQASKIQHEGELIILGHSWKKENKYLMTNVNSCETRLSHVSERYIFKNAFILQRRFLLSWRYSNFCISFFYSFFSSWPLLNLQEKLTDDNS